MSEIEEVKKRIDNSGPEGLLTSVVRNDYEPAGELMMKSLMQSGDFVQRKIGFKWSIYNKKYAPY